MTCNDIPTHLLEKMPVEEALAILGFSEQSEFGNPKRYWGPIEVVAGPWIPDWILIITIPLTSGVISFPKELKIGRTMCPIDILAIIYSACETYYKNITLPHDLKWGKIYFENYWKKMQEIYDRRPKLWVKKDFFRFCISYFDKYYDWLNEDYEVEFSYKDGQLRLQVEDDVVFCPARGTFPGILKFSARQLFRRIPKRFINSTVFIQVMEDNKATIASRIIPAQWVENPISKGKLKGHTDEQYEGSISLEKNSDVL